MTIGTNYFQSRLYAEDYYKLLGFNRNDVSDKIANGEIKIGFPVDIVQKYGSNPGFKLGKDACGRYNYTFNTVVKGG